MYENLMKDADLEMCVLFFRALHALNRTVRHEDSRLPHGPLHSFYLLPP